MRGVVRTTKIDREIRVITEGVFVRREVKRVDGFGGRITVQIVVSNNQTASCWMKTDEMGSWSEVVGGTGLIRDSVARGRIAKVPDVEEGSVFGNWVKSNNGDVAHLEGEDESGSVGSI